jgi:ArsR family transcriptional regulator
MSTEINLRKMNQSANQAVVLIKVLGNRDRMMLLCEINQGERCVTELETLLTIRREGKQIYYSALSPIAMSVMVLLYQNYCK